MGGEQNRVMENKYDKNALYTYMKLSNIWPRSYCTTQNSSPLARAF